MITKIILPQGRVIVTEYSLGDTVYLKVRSEKYQGIVTGLLLIPTDTVMYSVTWGSAHETRHYSIELVPEFEKKYDTDID